MSPKARLHRNLDSLAKLWETRRGRELWRGLGSNFGEENQ
jgi:hypothetical protein